MSFVLRHRPEKIGIELDDAGWIDVDLLLDAMTRHGRPITREMLDYIVQTNNKKRYAYSEDGRRIRASQGHSVDVELGYEPADPPEILFHGTSEAVIESIRREGLTRQKRHHVHLHLDEKTAVEVGRRRGRPILLTIRAKGMQAAGHEFFVTPNRVWLTDHVPPVFIDFPE